MPELEQALPKYVQIANAIRDQIARGDLRPGDEVPSERAIAVSWNVARPTATKALNHLRVAGLVDARQGAGTFVRRSLRLHSRAGDRYARSRQAGTIYAPGEYAEITAADVTGAPDHVAAALGLDAGAQAVRRRRVTRGPNGPVELSTSWFGPSLADDAPRLLDKERIREGTLAYIEGITGRRAEYARDEMAARLSTVDERRALDLGRRPSAVLVVRHVVYDSTNKPLEFAEAVYPPDRWAVEREYALDD